MYIFCFSKKEMYNKKFKRVGMPENSDDSEAFPN